MRSRSFAWLANVNLVRYKGDLKTHVQNVHSDMPELPDIISPPKKSKEGKRFPCPIEECPSGFKSKRDLGRHLRHKHPNFNSHEKDFIHYWKKEDEAWNLWLESPFPHFLFFFFVCINFWFSPLLLLFHSCLLTTLHNALCIFSYLCLPLNIIPYESSF